jgi:transaldolase/glucose-6-phosphate isomerase
VTESGMDFQLGTYQSLVDRRLGQWKREHLGRRLWDKDPAVWGQASDAEITNRLGWLKLPNQSCDEIGRWSALRDEILGDGITSVVLLGMGGSSLAPEVFQSTFGSAAGHPALVVLDSTHPQAVRDLEGRLALGRTLFVVSSKSGTTIETLSFFRYFFSRLSQLGAQLGDRPGRHFVAITDPGTPLETLGRERGFRRVEFAPNEVGGRYSALSAFGLLPASLAGVHVQELVRRAASMAAACGPAAPEEANPGVRLGAALGELALAGRDKLTFLASPSLASLPQWLEQLVAESTGKAGKGIVPIVDEPAPESVGTGASDPSGAPGAYGKGRVFVEIRLASEASAQHDRLLASAASEGHPVVRITLADRTDLGAEMYRWEVATAAACAVLGVHPFDQPDVELAKKLARRVMDVAREGAGPGAAGLAAPAVSAADSAAVERALAALLTRRTPGDYLSLQAYLAPTPATTSLLQETRARLGRQTGLPTTLGYGPRFLHSTGQLHKGGPDTVVCVQLVDDPRDDLAIPETAYSFGGLIAAQSLGDFEALTQRGRRVLRLGSQR